MYFADKELEVTAINVSEAGIGLLSEKRIPKYSIVTLTIVIFKGNLSGEVRGERPLQLKGKVCYSQPSEEANRYRLGICFVEIPSECRERLVDFLSVHA
jgi:c-di-GMP-binding flagellar brake protein YcgR